MALTIENKLNKILEVINWGEFTLNQKTVIQNIIETDIDSMSKATEICDYLGIQRYVNRESIINVI